MDTPESYRSIITGPTWEHARTLKNYVVEYTDKKGNDKSPICAIYFTSCNFYVPNTEEAFKKSLEADYYEWRTHKIKRASKHIFVRDVAKQFYVLGINNDVPTITDLIELLKKETEGYRVITVGSSAGAYMAATAGALMHAEQVFSFSALFNLNIMYKGIWDLYEAGFDDPRISQYYDLRPHIKNAANTSFFYMYPALNRDPVANDHEQNLMVKELDNVYDFPIHSPAHGVVIAMEMVEVYLNKTPDKLKKLHEKMAKKYSGIPVDGIPESVISIGLVGLPKFIGLKIRDYWRAGMRRLLK